MSGKGGYGRACDGIMRWLYEVRSAMVGRGSR